jgi:predicted LPLAT superfamily acyltransferase
VTSGPHHQDPAGAEWVEAGERGSRLALRFAVWGIRFFGRAPLKILLAPIACYYTLFAVAARRASRAYLARIDRARGGAGEARLLDSYRHFYSFAETILDRLSLWGRGVAAFEVVIHGREHMEAAVRGKTGALLLGAHLGNFDLLRIIAREADIPVNILTYTANAELINQAFEMLDPQCTMRIIYVDPQSVSAAFEVRRCVARGEIVALLGDRLHPGGRSRISLAPFLGELAAFSQGPFLLAQVLQTPVILALAVKAGPRIYDVFLEPLADGSPVPARERSAVIQRRVESYAQRLEHYCLRAPFQWFNFYDFWARVESEQR